MARHRYLGAAAACAAALAFASTPGYAADLTLAPGFTPPALDFVTAAALSDEFTGTTLAQTWQVSGDPVVGGTAVVAAGTLTLATHLTPAGAGVTGTVGVIAGPLPHSGSYRITMQGRFLDTGGGYHG